MATSPQECVECGEPLSLFQPACEDCGTAHEWSYRAPCHDCGGPAEYTEKRCPHCGTELTVWRAMEADVVARETALEIWKDAVPRPTQAGYQFHLGSIHGQWADYRRPVSGGDFHVRVYADHYELHRDDVSAIDAPARHLLRHGAPAATASGIDIARRVGGIAADVSRLAVRTPFESFRRVIGSERAETE